MDKYEEINKSMRNLIESEQAKMLDERLYKDVQELHSRASKLIDEKGDQKILHEIMIEMRNIIVEGNNSVSE